MALDHEAYGPHPNGFPSVVWKVVKVKKKNKLRNSILNSLDNQIGETSHHSIHALTRHIWSACDHRTLTGVAVSELG